MKSCYWDEAVHRPGEAQMRYLRAMIESHPVFARVPVPSLFVDPLNGPDRIQATRGED